MAAKSLTSGGQSLTRANARVAVLVPFVDHVLILSGIVVGAAPRGGVRNISRANLLLPSASPIAARGDGAPLA